MPSEFREAAAASEQSWGKVTGQLVPSAYGPVGW
jgi:hypothetical protein